MPRRESAQNRSQSGLIVGSRARQHDVKYEIYMSTRAQLKAVLLIVHNKSPKSPPQSSVCAPGCDCYNLTTDVSLGVCLLQAQLQEESHLQLWQHWVLVHLQSVTHEISMK
ncbi:hypothetical protein EVAR_54275_1 [Eumeta japonica]|uniref:Uncharacterized protein n=1 Tax=Eumeta variegata TaxID=151549 RepID=A0A4C1YSQ4_EUMVA|nr:hypothetical protein EVAR_54275_1 [Eumeta japonica]